MRALSRLFILVVLFLLSGCASLQAKLDKPTISAVSIALKHLDANSQTLELTLTLNNPNAIPIPISRLSAGLSLNNQGVIQGETTDSVTLPARGEAKMTLVLTSSLYKLVPSFKNWVQNPTTSLPYKLSGNIFIPLKSGGIPFDYSGRWTPPSPF